MPQKITTPVAEARMAVGKLSSQKIMATEYSKVPDLSEKSEKSEESDTFCLVLCSFLIKTGIEMG